MKKLVLVLVLAAGFAALKTEFRWEKNARAEWKTFARDYSFEIGRSEP